MRVRLSLKRMKAGYAIGVGFGVLLLVLGIYAMIHFFTVKQAIGNSTSFDGEAFIGSLVFFFFAIAVLRLTIPAFIPLKKNNLPAIRTCQYCGAIVTENALFCKKCNQQLD
jgi:hypothetical protein